MLKIIRFTILFISALFFMTAYADKTGINDNGSIICKQKYALCTSARCIYISKKKDNALCYCQVKEGFSLGRIACDKRIPTMTKNGLKKIISTFSLDEFKIKKAMTCPSGTVWSNCLDMPCYITPKDPTKAICICKIMRSGSYVTLGGNCDQSNCGKTAWSGATPSQNKVNVDVMKRVLKLKHLPNNNCRL